MNVRGAQLNGVLQHLVDEPYDRRVFGGAVQIRVFLVFVNDLKRRFFVQRVDRVRADAESFLHLAFDGLGGSENGLEPEARHGFERIQPLGREEAAGRDFDSAVGPSQGKQLFLEQNAGGKQGKKLAIRFDFLQRRVGHVIFLRQPSEDIFLGFERRLRRLAALPYQGFRIRGRQLLPCHHSVEQLLQNRLLIFHRVHDFGSPASGEFPMGLVTATGPSGPRPLPA